MRFAALLLMFISFNTITFADEGKQSTKNVLPPEKQMEKAINEYKKIVTDFYQFSRVVQTKNLANGLPFDGNQHRVLRLAMNKKSDDIVKLHKSLAISPDPSIYKKSKERRIELADKAEEIYKKKREFERTDQVKLVEIKRVSEDVGIELTMVTLLEKLSTVKKP
jgi:hypothetical protein